MSLYRIVQRSALRVGSSELRVGGGEFWAVIRAITFDAYGTLIHLDRPFERLREKMGRAGIHLPLDVITRAFMKEMGYYRDHHVEGRDATRLKALRFRCAKVLFEELCEQGCAIPFTPEQQVEMLMASIHFRLYDDVLPAFEWCQSHGLVMGVVSNWDCSLLGILEDLCPGQEFRTIVVSAIEGMTKSDSRLYEKAAKDLNLPGTAIVHIGDDPHQDVESAKRAGFRAVLIKRDPDNGEEEGSGLGPLIRAILEPYGHKGMHGKR